MKYGYLKFLILVLTFAIFWVKGVISLDPDFGFRLHTGSLIINQGFPRSDPYSYTMPSFPYVEHAWLIGVLWARLYPVIGKVGLAAISSVFALLALIISASRTKIEISLRELLFFKHRFRRDLWYFGAFPFLLATAVILPFSGVRAQVFSWVMMATLLFIVLNASFWKRWRIFLPALFLLWVNLHGSFAAGILTLFFIVTVRSFREKKFELADAVVLGLSLFATLFNPYGIDAWREVWLSVSDTSLRWRIAEWMPSIFASDLSMASLITVSAVLIWRYRRKFCLEKVGLYLLFLLQSILSRRHLPLWAIIAFPMTIESISYLYQEVKTIKFARARLKKFLTYAWIGSFVILIFQSFFSIRNATFLSEDRFYPREAISFIRQDLPEGQIFSEYGWGGYLIWKLPEKKVFIDGRMPSWRWGNNPLQESGAAFDDYLSLLKGEISYQEIFEKYGVDTVLWPVAARPGLYDYLQKKLDKFLARFGGEKRDFSLLEELEKDRWEEIYKDSVAVVYKKPD